jgi:hypothetical protein
MTRHFAVLLALAAATALEAGQTRRFVADTPRALADATGRGVAIHADGALQSLPPLLTVAEFSEPLGLALAVGPGGSIVVGTGHPARIYSIRDGKRALLGEVEADQVTTLLVDPQGVVWAATAVPALLIRVGAAGTLETVATLAEGNLWDLAWFHGGLVAAAGNPGRLMRLTPKGLEVAAEVPDTHARCLAVSGNTLFAGTSGKGLVVRWSGEGPVVVLADSTFTEIASLAVAADGALIAAALTGDPTMGKPVAEDKAGEPSVTVTVGDGPPPTPSSDKGGPATSEILRVLPTGAVTSLHRFSKQLAGSVTWSPSGPVIGTGMEGELWALIDGTPAQLDAVDAAQVVALESAGDVVLTQGPVKLMRRSGAPRGTFTSPALDAGQPAAWGEVAVRAQLPPGAACTMRFRSGATAEPGEQWGGWSAATPCAAARVAVPPARYLQWQLDLQGPATARVERVEIAYRQVNLPPTVKELTLHEPGEVFLKGAPPADRVVEVDHPDLSGIFTTLDDDAAERQVSLGKKYYRVGYRSLSWKAEDPNGDPLRFDVEIQPAGAGRWWPLRERLETTVLALDTQALADGVYRFRLTASDEPANPEAPERSARVSSFLTVDNAPPRVTLERRGNEWFVTVEDATSAIARVEWNRDADLWHALVPEDGLLDGRRETFRLPVAGASHVLAVRAVDDHHNRAVAAVEETP